VCFYASQFAFRPTGFTEPDIISCTQSLTPCDLIHTYTCSCHLPGLLKSVWHRSTLHIVTENGWTRFARPCI